MAINILKIFVTIGFFIALQFPVTLITYFIIMKEYGLLWVVFGSLVFYYCFIIGIVIAYADAKEENKILMDANKLGEKLFKNG